MWGAFGEIAGRRDATVCWLMERVCVSKAAFEVRIRAWRRMAICIRACGLVYTPNPCVAYFVHVSRACARGGTHTRMASYGDMLSRMASYGDMHSRMASYI